MKVPKVTLQQLIQELMDADSKDEITQFVELLGRIPKEYHQMRVGSLVEAAKGARIVHTANPRRSDVDEE